MYRGVGTGSTELTRTCGFKAEVRTPTRWLTWCREQGSNPHAACAGEAEVGPDSPGAATRAFRQSAGLVRDGLGTRGTARFVLTRSTSLTT